jgi:hypothetical protein
VRTTEIYTHVLQKGPRGVTSPMDRLALAVPVSVASPADSPPAPVAPPPEPIVTPPAPEPVRPFWRWLRNAAAGLLLAGLHK